MTIPAGSRSPKYIRITIQTGPVDGTAVAAVRLRVKNPTTKTEQTWGPMVPSSATAEKVVCSYTLASDGSSVPTQGKYPVAAWLYDSGGNVLDVTKEGVIRVGPPMNVTPPA